MVAEHIITHERITKLVAEYLKADPTKITLEPILERIAVGDRPVMALRGLKVQIKNWEIANDA